MTMDERSRLTVPREEPPLLGRLRQAVRASGLHVELNGLPSDERAVVVTNRLAQTTVRYLTSMEPVLGQRLSEELRDLTSPAEHDLLLHDRSFTFYHVVQFLYEWAKHYSAGADRRYFCYGMGVGGGGVEVEPNKEVISLLQILLTAMPATEDDANLGSVMAIMGPIVVSKIFSGDLFRFECQLSGPCQLSLSLEYSDPVGLRASLASYDLDDDAGQFLFNTALHVQGTTQIGWNTFAGDAENTVRVRGVIHECSAQEQANIISASRCEWTVEWTPEVTLRRLEDSQDILDRARTIYEGLHRRDLEYYLQRIQSLEVRIQQLEEGDRFHELVGRSRQMHQLYQLIDQVAASDLTILLRGESGTGKELVARAVHESSPRRDQPFVAVSCAAFTESLLESELFGHEKGAFTGADRRKPGRFEMADGGTLFLDEVGDLPITTQVKLLRALETRSFERVGGTESITVDVRIVAATNRDLEELIAAAQFRDDLYFRLNVVPVRVPPLREHAEDIAQLAAYFLQRLADRSGTQACSLSRGAVERLTNYTWPGNIRELRNVVERAAVIYAEEGMLREGDVVRALAGQSGQAASADPLNTRQRQVLTCLDESAACTIDDLLIDLQQSGGPGGRSRRTLQNDLRKLADMGYARWQKEGAARLYSLTPEGASHLEEMA
jgi:transcriptional regulator with GAF, ATPase, and Fis domain